MIKAVYKTHEEIAYTLRNIERIAMIACTACGYVNNVAGPEGLAYMRSVLESYGKEVVFAKAVLSCCWEALLRNEIEKNIRPIAGDIEALVVISCMGGVKAANLCHPGVPVIAACDSLGSNPQLPRGDTRTDPALKCAVTVCEDGHCVLTYTAGICPVSECPRQCKYGPCDDAPMQSGVSNCIEDPGLRCVWSIIEEEAAKRGRDISALREVERIHKSHEYQRFPSIQKDTPAWLKVYFGKLACMISGAVKPVIRRTN